MILKTYSSTSCGFYCSWMVVLLVIGSTSLRIEYRPVEPLADMGIFDPNARVRCKAI